HLTDGDDEGWKTEFNENTQTVGCGNTRPI
ncbi:unnamed protein product, partial [marine sediment metagenome]